MALGVAAFSAPTPVLASSRPLEQSGLARPPHIDPEVLRRRVAETFPEDADRAVRILGCESSDGLDPKTFDVTLDNGGPMQINRWWQPYFAERFGWTWTQIVQNLEINLLAARIVYDDASGWSPWECYTSGKVG